MAIELEEKEQTPQLVDMAPHERVEAFLTRMRELEALFHVRVVPLDNPIGTSQNGNQLVEKGIGIVPLPIEPQQGESNNGNE